MKEEQAKTAAPAAQPATNATTTAQPVAQPAVATTPAPAPEVVPQPASAPAPTPQVLPQPTTAPAPAPTPTATTTASIVPAVAPQQAAPTPPKGTDIQASAVPLNPIANNPQPAQTATPQTNPNIVQTTTPGTYAPSAPLSNTSIDTNVKYISAGENLKKKVNGPLVITIVVILLIALGAVGYFVVYPNIAKSLVKPRVVYETIIDNITSDVNQKINTLVYPKAIYNGEFELESNIDTLKNFTGYTYNGSLGIDPEDKNIQAILKIKDISSQEHSAAMYAKGDRQYLRLSSYRDLIYMGMSEENKALWNKLYDMSRNMNQDDFNYVVNKFSELVKAGFLDSKFTKEDASITIDSKNLKVLNHKYTIDNESVVAMFKSICDGFAMDDRAIDIFARLLKYSDVKTEDIRKVFSSFDASKKILEDNQVYYLNIYTYSTKNYIVGYEIVNGDNRVHYYFKDNFTEFKLTVKGLDVETGKEIDSTLTAIGVTEGGTTTFNADLDGKHVANIILNSWTEENKDLTYNITYGEQRINGAIKLNSDINSERAKLTFVGSINVNDKFIKLALTASEDWTSDVANINTGTSSSLSEYEIETKLNEFISKLKGSPIYSLFSTVSGDFTGFDGMFKDVFGEEKKVENPEPEQNNEQNLEDNPEVQNTNE